MKNKKKKQTHKPDKGLAKVRANYVGGKATKTGSRVSVKKTSPLSVKSKRKILAVKLGNKVATVQANVITVATADPIPKEKKKHYVNNKDLLTAILQYKKDSREAKRNKLPPTRMPEYVGQCLMLIAENLSHKPNFSNYPCRDEMIGDAIENCCMYFDNFDPKKSKNPFAYFTQIIYYAFLRRIHREKKQLYTKYKLTEQLGVLGEGEVDDEENQQPQFQMYDNLAEFIENYENSQHPKKRRPKGLEPFMEQDGINPLDPNQLESDL